MTDTCIDGEVQRVQAMLYAKARNEPHTRFNALYKYLTKRQCIMDPRICTVSGPRFGRIGI